MQSHSDKEHVKELIRAQFMEQLEARAETMKRKGLSEIAGGKPEEKELASWQGSNKMAVVHMPDDPQKINRISIGGGDNLPVTMNYCTIRGDVGECIKLLEMAIEALKESP